MSDSYTRYHVRSVLLAGSPYDAFLLEQAHFQREPALNTPQFGPYYNLVRTGKEVLEFCAQQKPDLIIADYALSDMNAFELGEKVYALYGDIPMMVVTNRQDINIQPASSHSPTCVKQLFVWYGDPEVLRTFVCLHEDEVNAATLLSHNKALAILFVEDDPYFFSHYLPTLYAQVHRCALEILPESQRPQNPWIGLKSRPLVLLRQTFESACEILDRYPRQLIAIISDMQFPVQGALDDEAGMKLLFRAHAYEPHLPIVVQSREIEVRSKVEGARGLFLWKDSPHLLSDLKEFLQTFCGFGPFVFRWPDGSEWARANTLSALRALVAGAPQAVFENHGMHNDFSAWLGVHGYVELAASVRLIRNMGPEGRARLVEMLQEAIDFHEETEENSPGLGWNNRGG